MSHGNDEPTPAGQAGESDILAGPLVSDEQGGEVQSVHSDAQRERAEFKKTDTQYEEFVIDKVEREGATYVVTFKGWSIGTGKHSPIEPKPGMVMRQYGRGFGYPVRGMDIAGVEFYYETPDEEQARFAREAAASDEAKRQEFEKNRAEMDAKYDALPEVFRLRIDKFRGNNPDFRWEYEPYEMFCCEQAVVFAAALGTGEAISKFASLPWDEQKKSVPGLSDEHSGNTFGCACRLAALYLAQPENVVRMHGALAPLVGSKEYGCIPKDADADGAGSETPAQDRAEHSPPLTVSTEVLPTAEPSTLADSEVRP